MIKNPNKIAELGRERLEENWRLRAFLKAFPGHTSKINRLAEKFGREAEAEMDCRVCAACCRENCIPLSEEEIERLAGHMKMNPAEFQDQYMTTDPDGEPALQATPCPFLHENLCSIYEDRPEACRGYPYIDGNLVEGMVGVIERAETCPIVFEMLERLKVHLKFHQLH